MTDSLIPLDEKRRKLLDLLRGYGRVAVAFSAGVDSTVVAKAASLACGDNAVAVTAVSSSLASGELEQAVELAGQIGIRHRIVETQEFDDPNYLANPTNRCYFCKTELYTRLESMLPQLGVDVIVNGANVDDTGDFRPGMRAADEHRVRSPLLEAGLTKADVRELARQWELPVWDKPATPCLSSRIAYGQEVTPDRVRRIDRAEEYLRERLNLRELRVRHEANDLARIEVPVAEIPRLLEPDTREEVAAYLRSLGFKFVTVDLDGFRSGSMNTVIPSESLRFLDR
ncbi:MAG: ATP-dependent sacrificial sulfur transferase LarE [Planctomycetaceae bacterium]